MYTLVSKTNTIISKTSCFNKPSKHVCYLIAGEIEDYTPYQAGSISFAPLNQWFIQRQNIQIWLLKHRRLTSRLLTAVFLLGFIVFLGFSIAHDVDGAIAPIVFASIIVVFSLYVYIRDNHNHFFSKNIFHPVHNGFIKVWPSLKW